MVWGGVRFFDLLAKPEGFLLRGGGETHFECSYCAHGLEDHAPHPINGSSMSLTTCLRYVLTMFFDGLAFEVWERRAREKLFRLHYIGSRKYVIENRNSPNQTFTLNWYMRKLNNSSNKIWEYQRMNSKPGIGKLEMPFRDYETRILNDDVWKLTTSENRTPKLNTNRKSKQTNRHQTSYAKS